MTLQWEILSLEQQITILFVLHELCGNQQNVDFVLEQMKQDVAQEQIKQQNSNGKARECLLSYLDLAAVLQNKINSMITQHMEEDGFATVDSEVENNYWTTQLGNIAAMQEQSKDFANFHFMIQRRMNESCETQKLLEELQEQCPEIDLNDTTTDSDHEKFVNAIMDDLNKTDLTTIIQVAAQVNAEMTENPKIVEEEWNKYQKEMNEWEIARQQAELLNGMTSEELNQQDTALKQFRKQHMKTNRNSNNSTESDIAATLGLIDAECRQALLRQEQYGKNQDNSPTPSL